MLINNTKNNIPTVSTSWEQYDLSFNTPLFESQKKAVDKRRKLARLLEIEEKEEKERQLRIKNRPTEQELKKRRDIKKAFENTPYFLEPRISSKHFNYSVVELLSDKNLQDKNLTQKQAQTLKKIRFNLASCATSYKSGGQFRITYTDGTQKLKGLTTCKKTSCQNSCGQIHKIKARTKFNNIEKSLEEKKIIFLTLTLAHPTDLSLNSSYTKHLLHSELLIKVFKRFRRTFKKSDTIFKSIENTVSTGTPVTIDGKKQWVRCGLNTHIHLGIFCEPLDKIFENLEDEALEISQIFYKKWLKALKNELKFQAKTLEPDKYYWLKNKTDEQMVFPPAKIDKKLTGGVLALVWDKSATSTGNMVNYLTKGISVELTGEKFKKPEMINGQKHFNIHSLLKSDIAPYIKQKLFKLLVLWANSTRTYEVLGAGRKLKIKNEKKEIPFKPIEKISLLKGKSFNDFKEENYPIETYLMCQIIEKEGNFFRTVEQWNKYNNCQKKLWRAIHRRFPSSDIIFSFINNGDTRIKD